jgi:hypothetical protein
MIESKRTNQNAALWIVGGVVLFAISRYSAYKSIEPSGVFFHVFSLGVVLLAISAFVIFRIAPTLFRNARVLCYALVVGAWIFCFLFRLIKTRLARSERPNE